MDEKRKRFEAENFVIMGIDLFRRLRHEQAKRCFQKALGLDPDNKVAKEHLEKIGIKIVGKPKIPQPIPVKSRAPRSPAKKKSKLRKTPSEKPKSTETWRVLASNLIDQGKYHDALVTFNEADELTTFIDRGLAKIRVEIIILADQFGNIPKNPVYDQDRKPPEYMVSWIQWADSAIQQRKFKDVIALSREITSVNENHEMGWYWLGLGQFHSGLIDEAFESFTKAANLGTAIIFEPLDKKLTVIWVPENNGRVRGLKKSKTGDESDIDVEAMVRRGGNLRVKKKNAEAEKVLREALEIEPNHMIAIRFLSGALIDQGRKKEERELYSTVNSETWLKWGHYLERIGKIQKAEEAFQQSAEMDKSNKEAVSKSREMKRYRDRKEKEQEPLKTGFEIVEEIRTMLKKTKVGKKTATPHAQAIPGEAMDFYKQGLDFENNHEYELAVNSHLRAIKTFSHFAECWCALGPPLFRLGWKREAEEVTKKAIKIDDSIPKIWADYGALLLYLKRYGESETTLLKAIDLDSKSAYVWNNLGTLYSITNRRSDAEKA
ncbi:MAG: tetratricopeptide repeat protein, partial [Candidatus Thorarchaeota archaeon]